MPRTFKVTTPFLNRRSTKSERQGELGIDEPPRLDRRTDGVRILELVHEQVLVEALVALQHIGVIVEELHRVHEQVVEVERVVGHQHVITCIRRSDSSEQEKTVPTVTPVA